MRKLLLTLLLFSRIASAQTDSHGPWLFAGFHNNSEDGVIFALSRDGFHWTLAHSGKPVLAPTQPGELMRDPFLQRAPDGSIHMVWTWAWRKPAIIGHSSSTDLIHWSPQQSLPVLANEPQALNAWAPALYWQPKSKSWLIFWSTTIPGRFPGPTPASNGLDHRIFFTTTKDFTHLAPAKVFFDPGFSVIDATFLPTPQPALVFKDERQFPPEKHIKTVTGTSMLGPWSAPSPPITDPGTEGPAAIATDRGLLVYYDHYAQPQHFGAVLQSPGTTAWHDVTSEIDFPAGMRHGSFLRLTEAEYQRLLAF